MSLPQPHTLEEKIAGLAPEVDTPSACDQRVGRGTRWRTFPARCGEEHGAPGHCWSRTSWGTAALPRRVLARLPRPGYAKLNRRERPGAVCSDIPCSDSEFW